MGGEWSPCTHLKVYGLNFAPMVARFLAFQLAPKTALEFGCGLGTTSDYIARFGNSHVTCIEPEATLGELIMSLRSGNPGNGQLDQMALNVFSDEPQAKECVASGSLKKELVFSFEVAEHIPAMFRPALVDFLVNSTGKWLVFSAARPGQGGTGHIDASMLTSEEWKRIFTEKGLVFMPRLTFLAQNAAYPSRNYDLALNLLVFKHPSNDAKDTDEPHEMLSIYNEYWGGTGGVHGPNTEERANKINAFNAGSNSALWPDLTAKEARAKESKLCMRSVAPGANQSRLSRVKSSQTEAFTSAWAAHFFAADLD